MTEKLIEAVAKKVEGGKTREVHDKLQSLTENARRGILIRERYSPKVGRAFLISRPAR